MEQPKTRQELYEQIRRTGGRNQFILEEMIRLGFLEEGTGLPEEPAEETRRAAELRGKLDELRRENRRLHNEQALIREMRRSGASSWAPRARPTTSWCRSARPTRWTST